VLSLGMVCGLVVASAWASATTPPPTLTLKVLLIGSGASDPTTTAWEAALSQEGVPYTEVTATNTANLGSWSVALPALTAGSTGNYNGVVIADSPADFAAGQLTALDTYEAQFGVRQFDGYVYPSTTLGVTAVGAGALDGTSAQMTTPGLSVLPGLAGPLAFDVGSYGYPATVSSSAFTSWLSYTGGTTSLGGAYQHPSTDAQANVQEAALFFAYNQNQTQWHVLAPALINWVTQNAHLGLFRNYVSLHLDDMFNSDNTWDTTTHTTSLTATAQMSAADIAAAAQWSRLNNFRIDWAFNGGVSSSNASPATADAQLAQFQATDPATGKSYAGDFGWINHTWDHATLDQGCTTTNYIEAEINQNAAFATAAPGTAGLGGLGLTADPNGTSNGYGTFDVHTFVPGEHSGLANLIPGTNASIDPVDSTGSAGGSGGTLARGTYNYAATAQYIYNTGDSQTSAISVNVAAGQKVTLNWTGVCKAASYHVYRQNPGSTTWNLIATVNPPSPATLDPTSITNTTGGGMAPVSYTDTGTAGTATTFVPSLTVSTALEDPYQQNQFFNAAITAAGITAIGADASKPYPNPPTTAFGINTTTPYTGAEFPAGQSFADGTAQVVPRHPINIYYNAATWPEEIDEYNTIYPGSSSTQTSITNQVVSGMFSTITNNDPEPFFAHQTNMVGASVGTSVVEPVITRLITQYNSVFSAAEPYVQPTLAQAALAEQRMQAWATALAAGTVTATEQGGTIVVKNTGAQLDIPINAPTGTLTEPGATAFGSAYAGSVSDWVTVPAGGSYTLQAPAAPYVTTQPANQGVSAGQTATFTAAATNGETNPPASVQWDLSTDGGLTWNPVPGATSATLTLIGTTASMSGNEYEAIFTNGLGSATSSAATLTVNGALAVAPAVITQPSSQTATAGSTVTFSAAASGTPTPTVQWNVSTNNGSTWTAVSGATSTSLTLGSVTTAMSGNRYEAVFSNSAGTATTAAATLTVNQTPAITSAATASGTRGTAFRFTFGATGSPTPTITASGTLPRGLTFTGGTGTATLSGTPSSRGTFTLTISAKNTVGTATQRFTLRIN